MNFALLHCVKVSLEDFPRASEEARRALADGRVLLPSFIANKEATKAYAISLDKIAEANGVK